MMQNQQNIFYLHGFNSSPQSNKAQQFLKLVEQDYPHVKVHCPQLHHRPRQAMDDMVHLVNQLHVDTARDIGFVGSSLGGFYATWLADYFACRAVLINPAVCPDKLLKDYLGWQQDYHGNGMVYEFTLQHLQELKALRIHPIKVIQNLWVLLQTGDETLDYRDALSWYQGCLIDVQEGGSHAYDGFIDKVAQIKAFLS